MADEAYLRSAIAESNRAKQSAMRLARTSPVASTRARMQTVAKAHAIHAKTLRAELRQIKAGPAIAKGMRKAQGVLSRATRSKVKSAKRSSAKARKAAKSSGGRTDG